MYLSSLDDRALSLRFSWRSWAIWFLVVPNLIFQAFWLRFPYYVLCTGVTVTAGMLYSRLQIGGEVDVKQKTLYKYVIGSLLITFIFVYFSGAGGLVRQKPDWIKHNVVLHDLMVYSWPVQYSAQKGVPSQTLVYYLAYYLIPAAVGKLWGWGAANAALFIQTCVGVWLFANIIRKELRFSVRYLFLFFFISGADILGIYILQEWPAIYIHIENYAIDLQFSSVLTQLSWVPQHALAGWIGVALAYQDFKHDRLVKTLPFLAGILLLWSPFVALGIVLVFIPFYLFKKAHVYLNTVTFAGLAVSVVSLLYLMSRVRVIDDKAGIYLLARRNVAGSLGVMLLFLILDVYVFGLFFVLVRRAINKTHQKFITWLFIVLILIAQIMYGASNDFAMRVSIPALVMVFVLLLSYIHELEVQKPLLQVVVISILVCGMFTPFAELLQTQLYSEFAPHERPKVNMTEAEERYRVLNKQYLGDTSKPFAVLLGNYRTYDR